MSSRKAHLGSWWKRFDFKLLAICLLGIVLSVKSASGKTNVVSGGLTADITWSGTNLLQGAVTVPKGVVVTIAPGTRLLMDRGATLLVQGQLLANGTESQPIHFTRAAAGMRWERIRFVGAQASRLRHCIIEYANSAGTHLDYYDNDCNPATALPPRVYHEAVVVLASHVDIEGCIFRNLPDDSPNAEGDAIAILSDDPTTPGTASAHLWNCQFLSIGQGVHTRYSYVLVENCFFTNHHGDNDDIDMYGESTPPPLIRNNLFLNPAHDDMINPTRCSAVIIGNVISGGDDHGIVLRDKCSPVVMNNLIYDCANGGIAIQNQCDALLVNNTIVNCGRGIRFFDHTGRWGPPYCLSPGSGRATVINCIIWGCPTSLELQDSPFTQDRGSHLKVIHSNIERGQASASVSANSTLSWGEGMISSDPLFLTNRFRLGRGSPCIDTGTNLSAVVTHDLEGMARPLDGNGDGSAEFDMGAHEFLLLTADSNHDGIPDGWVQRYGLSPVDSKVATSNPDGDPHTTFQEWIADTDPTNALSFFRIATLTNLPPVAVFFLSSSNRQYTLFYSTNLTESSAANTIWTSVPGQVGIPGQGGGSELIDTNVPARRFYRVGVNLPETPRRALVTESKPPQTDHVQMLPAE